MTLFETIFETTMRKKQYMHTFHLIKVGFKLTAELVLAYQNIVYCISYR